MARSFRLEVAPAAEALDIVDVRVGAGRDFLGGAAHHFAVFQDVRPRRDVGQGELVAEGDRLAHVDGQRAVHHAHHDLLADRKIAERRRDVIVLANRDGVNAAV